MGSDCLKQKKNCGVDWAEIGLKLDTSIPLKLLELRSSVSKKN